MSLPTCVCSQKLISSAISDVCDSCKCTEDSLPLIWSVPSFSPNSSDLAKLCKPSWCGPLWVGLSSPTMKVPTSSSPIKPQGDKHALCFTEQADKIMNIKSSCQKESEGSIIRNIPMAIYSAVSSKGILKPSKYSARLSIKQPSFEGFDNVREISPKDTISLQGTKACSLNIVEMQNAMTKENWHSLGESLLTDSKKTAIEKRRVTFSLKKKVFLIPYSPRESKWTRQF
jgi:hypothetical protein